MSDVTVTIDRDEKSGRFLPGNAGNGGRKPGQRNKLGEQFLSDLRDVWATHGVTALERCAVEEPAAFVRVIAGLLPRDVNINASIGVDAGNVLDAFRQAVAALGNAPPAALPKVKVIDGR